MKKVCLSLLFCLSFCRSIDCCLDGKLKSCLNDFAVCFIAKVLKVFIPFESDYCNAGNIEKEELIKGSTSKCKNFGRYKFDWGKVDETWLRECFCKVCNEALARGGESEILELEELFVFLLSELRKDYLKGFFNPEKEKLKKVIIYYKSGKKKDKKHNKKRRERAQEVLKILEKYI